MINKIKMSGYSALDLMLPPTPALPHYIQVIKTKFFLEDPFKIYNVTVL